MSRQARSLDLLPTWFLATVAVVVAIPVGGGAVLGAGRVEGIGLAVLLAVVVGILRAVYVDAERQGMGGTLWTVVVLVLQVIGLVVYLAIRARRKGPHGDRSPSVS